MMRINWINSFIETARRLPDAIAVTDGERDFTFSDILNAETALAGIILERTNRVVCRPLAVFLPKCAETVIADTAIIHSGNAYMNMDVKTPPDRLAGILTTIRPALILTDAKNAKIIEPIAAGIPVVCLDLSTLSTASVTLEELNSRIGSLIDTDPFCLINTSGSTGTPKGVVLNHKSFFDFIDCATETWDLKDGEIIGSLSPVIFDIYSFELCMMFAKGARIVLIPDSWAMFPIKILELLAQKRVSFIFWVPTIMVNIANMGLLEKISIPDLKMIWFAGEVFPTQQFNVWRKRLSHARFVNLYGPIEITLDCTWFEVTRDIPDDEPIPIGFPCRNSDVLILNDENRSATDSEEGELCVRGTSLAMGYYNNPEKTAAAFVQNPLNSAYPELIYRTGDIVCRNWRGEIVFKGRKDSLVKHSGYRIELAEIEHVIINTLKLVQNGCVVYNFKAREITLFYEATQELNIAEFRKRVAAKLPKYMIPTVCLRMESLPRGGTGKVDRALLNKQVNG